MGLLEIFKRFGKTLFIEDQFVESDERDDLMKSIVESGMSMKEGSYLVQASDEADKIGKKLNKEIDASVREDGKDYRTDSTMENITNGVDLNQKNEDIKTKTLKTRVERERDE